MYNLVTYNFHVFRIRIREYEENFFQKALKNSIKQVLPIMEQQNYLRTIFGHALATYGTRYFHFWSLVCSHFHLLIQ